MARSGEGTWEDEAEELVAGTCGGVIAVMVNGCAWCSDGKEVVWWAVTGARLWEEEEEEDDEEETAAGASEGVAAATSNGFGSLTSVGMGG